MERKNSKTKHSTLQQLQRWLKDVDVLDENFHEWKIIPVYLIKTNFYKNFKFPPRLKPSTRSLKKVLTFYKGITKYFSCSLYLRSAILSQNLWFNLNIKIDNKSIFISGFASKNINFVGKIIHKNDKTNHEIILNQNTTLKANRNIVGFN